MSQKKNKAETTQNEEILISQEKESVFSQETEIDSSNRHVSGDNLAKLTDCFNAWPDVKELWQTSDGTCFFHKADAVNYARTINGEVKLFKRDELQNSKK
jgi:hypothetical protein